MEQFNDHDAALIDDIRKEFSVDASGPEIMKFEIAVARVVAARLTLKVKNKKKKEKQ